jgi:ABC-type glycerol-3-phosphate transport system substrate-binding protein
VAEAVQWYADLVTRYGVMPDPRELDGLALQRLPHEAAPAMWLSGSWYRDEFAAAGIVPLPESDGVGVAPLSARGAMISAGTTHPREAWRWVAFLSEQPPFTYSDAVPARESVIRATATWRKMDPALAAVFQYNREHAVDVPGTVCGALLRAYKAALEGASVEAALAEEQTRANETLARLAEASDEPAEAFTVAPPAPASSEEAIEIRFWVLYSGDLDLYRALAQQFAEAHPGIHVQVEPSSYWPIAEQAAEADCFVGYAYGVGESRESLLALDPLLAEAEGYRTDVFYPDYLAPLLVDGALWGLPLDMDARLLYYHRDRFDQADAPYPSADWTPRDLVARARDLTDLDAPEPRYGFYPTSGAYVDAATYVAWLGGQLSDGQGQPTFADPTVVEAIALYAGLITGAAPPQALERTGDRLSGVTVTWGERPGPIQLGHVAMWIDDHEHHVAAGALDFAVGVAPLPVGAVSFNATLRALYISANATHPDACWAWITFLSAQPQAVRMLPVRRDVAESDAWRERAGPEAAQAWSEILARPQALQPSWYTDPVADRALYWFDEALAQVLDGVPPVDALASAQSKASAFTACMQENVEDRQAWRACARQADPAVTLPE